MNRGFGTRLLGVILALALTGMAMGFLIGMMEESRFSRNPVPVFAAAAAGAIFFAVLRGPIGKAIARMLEGPPVADDQLLQRVEMMEAQLADRSFDDQRVAELEERLDFTERILAQRQILPAQRDTH